MLTVCYQLAEIMIAKWQSCRYTFGMFITRNCFDTNVVKPFCKITVDDSELTIHLATDLFTTFYNSLFVKFNIRAQRLPRFSNRRSVRHIDIFYFLLLFQLFLLHRMPQTSSTYRVGQIKRRHCAFLLVTNECIYQNLWFLAHINYIKRQIRRC